MRYHKFTHYLVLCLLLGLGIFGGYYLHIVFMSPDSKEYTTVFSVSIWTISYLIILIKVSFYKKSYGKDKNIIEEYHKTVVAIVPSYNETEVSLHRTIKAILAQSYPVQSVIVVDDGSDIPIIPFEHPRVQWYTQKNQGKRYAQVNALKKLNLKTIDYLLTVDSDSVIEVDAVKKMIIQFKYQPNLNAITGFVLTKNVRQNIMTRVADLNIAISCLISRPVRSFFGALETTSGALSMYKTSILSDNLEDYLTSGTYSDDRQLCFYSVCSGDAISMSDLIVYSDMPTTFSQTLRQRMRWAKGSWRFFPKQMAQLRWRKKIFPLISMIQTLSLYPLYLILIVACLTGYYSPIVLYLCLKMSVRFLYTLLYIRDEQRMSVIEKLVTLFVISPIELAFSLIVLPYLKLKAIFFLKDSHWETRSSTKF